MSLPRGGLITQFCTLGKVMVYGQYSWTRVSNSKHESYDPTRGRDMVQLR